MNEYKENQLSIEGMQRIRKIPVTLTVSSNMLDLSFKGSDSGNDNNDLIGLPAELLCHILGHFTLDQLYSLKQVCKLFCQVIQNLPDIAKLRANEINLIGSELWWYLPAILNNQSISELIQGRLYPIQISEIEQSSIVTMADFCSRVQNQLTTCQLAFPYQNKFTAKYFTQQAQFICNYVEQYGQPSSKKLEDWYAFTWQYHKKQQEVFQAYLELESLITALIFVVQFSCFRRLTSKISEICDLQKSRWLNGESLVYLDIVTFRLLYKMIEQSIHLHIYLEEQSTEIHDSDVQRQYQQRLIAIDTLLKRIQYSDWLHFLETDKIDLGFCPRARLLSHGLKINHPVIPVQLKGTVSNILANCNEQAPRNWWSFKNKTKENEILSSYFETDDQPTDSEKKEKIIASLDLSSQAGLRRYKEMLLEKLESLEPEEDKPRENQKQSLQQPLLALSQKPTQAVTRLPPRQIIATRPAIADSPKRNSVCKTIGLIFLFLFGLGLCLTGVGSFFGVSLLFLPALPFFAKILLLGVGAICSITSVRCAGNCSAEQSFCHEPRIHVDKPTQTITKAANSSYKLAGQSLKINRIRRTVSSPALIQKGKMNVGEHSSIAYYSGPFSKAAKFQSQKRIVSKAAIPATKNNSDRSPPTLDDTIGYSYTTLK